jgi:uncharacterized secreted protein with C-terminal beta-propeller domain
LATGLAVGLAAVLGLQAPAGTEPVAEIPFVTAAPAPKAEGPLTGPSNYQSIYERLAGLSNAVVGGSGGGAVGATADGSAELSFGGGVVPTAASGTNVQVADIDEGDLVKTDGRIIFVANGSRVALFEAAGPATRQLSGIDFGSQTGPAPTSQVLDLMVWQSRLVVFLHEYVAQEIPTSRDDFAYVYYQAANTRTLVYDVSDPTQPDLVVEFAQSGAYQASRLSGSSLYLLTNHQILGPIDPNAPDSFVPQVSGPPGRQLVPLEDIHVMPRVSQPTYAVVSAIDLAEGRRLGQESVLGGSGPIHMTADNLYLTTVDDDRELILGGFSDMAWLPPSTTYLVRLALADGPQVAASGQVEGVLNDQFSLDEHQGSLRVATTVFEEWELGWRPRPQLSVFDQDLNLVGSIPHLIENEQIQAVRFMGETGYVVTFRQVDPLFSLDLSDPTQPTVLGALEIPGFSDYLHPWTDDLLVGFGYNGDQTGLTSGLKLSLFDLADPAAVSELATESIDYDSSEALQNHHAFFASLEQGLIGFLVERWTMYDDHGVQTDGAWHYLVYQVDPVAGFQLRQTIDLTDLVDPAEPSLSVRGLVLGDHFYLCAPSTIQVFELDAFRKVGRA